MDNELNEAGMGSKVLKNVREGMDVYDREGKKIGSVDEVYLGSVDETEADWGKGPATNRGASSMDREGTLLDNVIDAMSVDNDVERDLVRSRLEREGFVRIAGGLLASDRYILPDQIAAVEKDRISLRGRSDDLLSG